MKTKLINLTPIILCVLLFITPFAHGQEVNNPFNKTPQEMHDMFMKKSKSNKIAGFVILGSGVAMIVGGIGINMQQGGGDLYYSDSDGFYVENPNTNKGLWLSYLGGGVTLASIPLFISTSSNKRKAKLALKKETVALGVFNKSNNFSLSVTIPF